MEPGDWEIFTIYVDAPPDMTDEQQADLLADTNELNQDLKSLVNKYNGKHGMKVVLKDTLSDAIE